MESLALPPEVHEELSSSEKMRKNLDGGGKYGHLVVKVIILAVIASTVSFSLSTVEELNDSMGWLFNLVELTSVTLFTIEYATRLFVAESFWAQVFDFYSIIDLCSILPSWLDFILPGDQFPAIQFLRMTRIFKFLSQSSKGEDAMKAFSSSWEQNRPLLLAASFAGGAVWLATSALEYFTEKDNDDQLWCYPPPKDSPLALSGPCECDWDDGCSGAGCYCENRFKSIPAAMFQVIVNLAGEFPLADNYTMWGRVLASMTAVVSVGVFAIPTGLVGASLEGAIAALDSGDEKDYDVDDEDVQEILDETSALTDDVRVPVYTTSPLYKQAAGFAVLSSSVVAILSTVTGLGKSFPVASYVFYLVNLVSCVLFLMEHLIRIHVAGLDSLGKTVFTGMGLIDLMAWAPDLLWIMLSGPSNASVQKGVAMSFTPIPAWVGLTSAIFRMLKFERYIHGFSILGKVFIKSEGVLAIGGMAAACVLIFASTLMYYAERDSPDPKMAAYYSSVPASMWITLLNLSGEVPLSDYQTSGAIIVGTLSVTACAIFAIPVGALGSGFEEVIGAMKDEGSDGSAEEHTALTGGEAGGPEAKYGAIPTKQPDKDPDALSEEDDPVNFDAMTEAQRTVVGYGEKGAYFQKVSLFATLFAVGLEIISTCQFASETAEARNTVDALEVLVVLWFTFEFVLRAQAHGLEYIFSPLGIVDMLATFPFYFACGLLGRAVAARVDVYDGPLRGLRILRLVRLDEYAPSLSLVDDAFRACSKGLAVSCFAGVVMIMLFNECLYFSERLDEAEGEDKRFRSALSALQYSSVLMTGDYPIVDFSVAGKVACSIAVVVAVGVVAVPASILASAFVEILEAQSDDRRQKRYEAAVAMQRMWRRRKAGKNIGGESKGKAFKAVVTDAVTNSQVLRGLDSNNPTFAAQACIWKNRDSSSANTYRTVMGVLIFANILAVILESMPSFQSAIPHSLWQTFETLSVLAFTGEYLLNVVTAPYDPKYGFSSQNFCLSFIGLADFFSVAPFYVQQIVIPIFAPQAQFDATIFRILRLARVLELERFFEAFTLLDDVFVKAAPVLKATGVLALIVWVGASSLLYYVEPHEDLDDDRVKDQLAAGGEDPAVFTSIVDAMYYCTIFLAGEWCKVDFTPLGSVICTVVALIGVALFSIPVGVLFEGFQDMMAEKAGVASDDD